MFMIEYLKAAFLQTTWLLDHRSFLHSGRQGIYLDVFQCQIGDEV